MNLTNVLLANAAVIAGTMFLLWLYSVAKKDASIVDIFWGLGFVLVAWNSFGLASDSTGWRTWIIAGMATLWGLRLGGYLWWRNHGKPEDYRYVAMREKHGDRFWIRSLWTVFGLQGAIMWIVSLPIQAGTQSTNPINALDAVGVCVWSIGLLFEAVGDWQLSRFKADERNRGRVMDRGLWRYTRHPNYFGDFLVWWGMYLVAASGGMWWTVISPLMMSFFLMKVSGVTLLEKSLRSSKEGYEDYVQRTNAFFPWWPRRAESSS